MKNHPLNYLKPLLFTIPFLIFSCSEDEDPIDSEPNLGVVEEDFEVRAAYEDTEILTLEVLQSSGLGFRTQSDADICTNTVVTHDESTKKITIDFGTGCTSPNGIVRKGKILLSYSGSNFLLPGTTIVTTFDGYETNGLKIEGKRTITNAGIDIFAKKVTLNVKVENGKVTWPDNTSVTWASTQTRVLTLLDERYEASITGGASGNSREGIDYTVLVTDALVAKEDCRATGNFVPSQGKLEFSILGNTLTADLGEGACDKIVIVTYPGGSKEITMD
ncbi:hypothetical protein GCM10009119_07100 [Algoriphagus jejuensis]|uniref:Lipoprotein n=1 Tax=Algoriphagus jejuensis TaxID=419934 RepID=A0ABN1MWX0_9BACT